MPNTIDTINTTPTTACLATSRTRLAGALLLVTSSTFAQTSDLTDSADHPGAEALLRFRDHRLRR